MVTAGPAEWTVFCDSSKNKHATAHFHATGHPIMRTIEPGESRKWCYVDEVMVD